MVTEINIRTIALSFPEATECPHFDKTSFRVKQKIFATMNVAENRFVVKLTEIQQSVYGAWDQTACYPVPNGFGKMGWTIVEFGKVDEAFVADILKESYLNVAPKKLKLFIER